MLTILFDGVAYGMLLFVLAVGLAVTMGLMNFINLAHGAFAMAGGYLTVVLMQRLDVPFLWCLPLAFLFSGALGALLERTLYRPMYAKPHLDQVLFSIGLTFMAVAGTDYFLGSTQQIIQLPNWLRGRTELGTGAWTLGMGHYRLFIIAVCAALTVALQFSLARTRFGSRLRASVDDQRVASGLGINVNMVFLSTFAVGSMQQNIHLPAWLQGRFDVEWVGIGKYRLFIIVVCGVLTIALQGVLSRTRFGSRLRASVDDPRVAGGLGLDVNRIFLLTFAVGSGLAGLGGALGAEVLGLDPTFPLKFMIYFLIVVAVGGTSSITGPLLAALLLGVADVAGKYYIPKMGAFIVYSLMIVILIWRPQGLFVRRGGKS